MNLSVALVAFSVNVLGVFSTCPYNEEAIDTIGSVTAVILSDTPKSVEVTSYSVTLLVGFICDDISSLKPVIAAALFVTSFGAPAIKSPAVAPIP